MGLLGDLARLLLGGHDDDDQPSEGDYEEAEAIDDLTQTGGEGEQYYNEGIDMGTVPDTPHEYQGGDTDPEHPAIRPWWRFW